jgi:hypothetical protein
VSPAVDEQLNIHCTELLAELAQGINSNAVRHGYDRGPTDTSIVSEKADVLAWTDGKPYDSLDLLVRNDESLGIVHRDFRPALADKEKHVHL